MSAFARSILFLTCAAALSMSCTKDDTFIMRIDARYRLGCNRVRMAPSPIGCDEVQRTINGDEGTDGIRISCNVRTIDDSTKALTMSVSQPGVDGTVGFEIVNAIFAADGVLQNSGGASFTLIEKANRYSGLMTANDPVPCTSENAATCTPCKISGFAIEEDVNTGSPYVRASIYCDGLPQLADIANTREFTNDRSGGEGDPASFGVFFCDGI